MSRGRPTPAWNRRSLWCLRRPERLPQLTQDADSHLAGRISASNARSTATSQSCGGRNFRLASFPRLGQVDQCARDCAQIAAAFAEHASDAYRRRRADRRQRNVRRASSRRIAPSMDGGTVADHPLSLCYTVFAVSHAEHRLAHLARAMRPETGNRSHRQRLDPPHCVEAGRASRRAGAAATGPSRPPMVQPVRIRASSWTSCCV